MRTITFKFVIDANTEDMHCKINIQKDEFALTKS